MKDFTKQQFKEALGSDFNAPDANDQINHALKALFSDTTTNSDVEFVNGLTFEELISTLLTAQLEINSLQEDFIQLETEFNQLEEEKSNA